MRLIDADALNDSMYHEAFETDSELQKWDSGCWIRYTMFENHLDNAPTADAVPVVRCGECANAKRIGKNESVYTCTHPQWTRRPHKDTFEESQLFHGLDGNDFCSYGAKMEEHHEAD